LSTSSEVESLVVDVAPGAREHLTVLLMEGFEVLASVREQKAHLDGALGGRVDAQAPVLARFQPLRVLGQDHLACHRG